MFPSKPMFDYMDEINRLFPRPIENDLLPSPSAQSNTSFLSSPMSSGVVNRSSSSADSMSPDSFPHISTIQSPDLTRLPHPSTFPDTPMRRYRPIVGRKFQSTAQPVHPNVVQTSPPRTWDQDVELAKTIWQNDEPLPFSHTPPKDRNFSEQKNSTQNVYYELFPNKNVGYENKTPVKAEAPLMTSSSCNVSPDFSQISRSPLQSPILPNPSHSRAISPMYNVIPSSSNSPPDNTKVCTFCRKNGETPVVFMTHTVKERVGNTFIVSCPILRSHVCSTCGGTGDNAHTITYCPVLRNRNNGRPLQSTTITLKNTRIKSNGRKRF
ncbi:uncharacterized protein LOC113519227 [Galleria mellonella]|uniref:Uncharacterized protein LOC113519227 n=1 Tax=Galleria mellonella TaxID=7137 RepID=A0A6J1X2W5_GALME|nr:uncharacterized protein LOC113519227 [Galleria mellonella]